MVPTVLLPPVTLFTCHCTDVSVAPVTVAVNCWVAPAMMVAPVGEMEMLTVPEPLGFTVTVALADLVVSAWETAVTVTVIMLVVAGAVYRPLLETVPTLLLPPATLFTCH